MENHFKAYDELMDRIRTKNMQLLKLKEDYYSISGVRYDDIKIKGGKPVDMADQLHNIVEKEKELVATMNYKEELRRIHELEINKIASGKKRTILKLFYLDGCSIKQIAYCLRITEGHTKKLKREAIKEFIEKVIKGE